MQLSGGSGPRQHETLGWFADAGKCQRTDDGAVRAAAAASCVRWIVFSEDDCQINAALPPFLTLSRGLLDPPNCRSSLQLVDLVLRTMAISTKEKPDIQKQVHEVPHNTGVHLIAKRLNRRTS